MRTLFRICAALSGLVIISALAAPLVLYSWAISRIDGRPQRPAQMASVAEQARIWKQAGGGEPVVVEGMNPYGFLGGFFGDSRRGPAGEVVSYWVARSYMLEHRRGPGMLAWHCGVAALTIWITRNWSTQEILTVASETLSADPRAPLRIPK